MAALSMMPIRAIFDCCARAAIGHATAAPPTNEMKLRRLMCPQIEGPNLPYRRGANTALCITAKLVADWSLGIKGRLRQPGDNHRPMPGSAQKRPIVAGSEHSSRDFARFISAASRQARHKARAP